MSDRPKKAYFVDERWSITKSLLVFADSVEDAKCRVHKVDSENIEGLDTTGAAPRGFGSVRRAPEEDRDA